MLALTQLSGFNARQFAGTVINDHPFPPVAWWALDEASGNRADATGNGHTMVVSGTVYQESGIVVNAAGKPGNTQGYLEADDAVGLRHSTAFTVCGWFKVEAVGSTTFFAKGFEYVVASAGGFVIADVQFSGGLVSLSADAFPVHEWFFVALRVDGTACWLRVNHGTPATATASGSPSTYIDTMMIFDTVTFGGPPTAADELGVWQHALTDNQIDWLYNFGAGRAFTDL